MRLELGLGALEEAERVEVDPRVRDPLGNLVEELVERRGLRVRVDEDERPPRVEPQRDEAELLLRRCPPSSLPRGAVMRRPSRPYVQAWYGHWSVSRLPEPSQTSEPRWRQTLRKARSVVLRSRTSDDRDVADPDGAGTIPAPATSSRVADVLPRAAEDALALELQHGRIRVPAPREAF